MSFSMTMGNSRIDRIKMLQLEKKRNENLRKTGVNVSNTITKPKPKQISTPLPSRANNNLNNALQYVRCPYCNQQILSNNVHHHISFCNAAYKSTNKGNCSACQQFRNKN
tara:strand:+ start:9710 stop:10039 length:330 start_codon:yes stop_codon:yes gene_type:complete